MATTKKAVRFYADDEVARHLETIPAQTRTTWINKVLSEAIKAESRKGTESHDVIALMKWLGQQENRPPLYEAVYSMLYEFESSK